MRLRGYEPTDPEALNPLFNDPEVLAGLGNLFPQPVADFRDFVERGRDPKQLHLVIETLRDRTPIGACALFDIDGAIRTAMLGIWLGKPFWDGGHGTDAMRTLCRFAFRQLNLRRLELGVYASNPRAIRVYERVGFVREGTQRRHRFFAGHYEDSYLMGLLAEELVED